MTTKCRAWTAAIIAVSAVSLAACTSPTNDETASASINVADVIESACKELGPITPADQLALLAEATTGAPDSSQTESYTACDNYRAGTQLIELRNRPVTWDQQCLEGAGWTLTENQTPVPRNAVGNGYYPAEVAACASPIVTPEVCESVRQALAPGQTAISYENASVITKLGCSNIEFRVPN